MALSTHDFSIFTVHLFDVSADTEMEVVDRNSFTVCSQEGAMMMKLQRSVVFGQVGVRSEAEGMQSRKLFAEGILWFAGRSLFSVISPRLVLGSLGPSQLDVHTVYTRALTKRNLNPKFCSRLFDLARRIISFSFWQLGISDRQMEFKFKASARSVTGWQCQCRG